MINKTVGSEELAQQIVEAIQDRKGNNIKLLDLRKLDYAVSDFFVICEAESSTQINAIFENIDAMVKKNLGQDPINVEGREESIWLLMDYMDVVVHIFKPEARAFYRLEALWAESSVKEFN